MCMQNQQRPPSRALWCVHRCVRVFTMCFRCSVLSMACVLRCKSDLSFGKLNGTDKLATSVICLIRPNSCCCDRAGSCSTPEWRIARGKGSWHGCEGAPAFMGISFRLNSGPVTGELGNRGPSLGALFFFWGKHRHIKMGKRSRAPQAR